VNKLPLAVQRAVPSAAFTQTSKPIAATVQRKSYLLPKLQMQRQFCGQSKPLLLNRGVKSPAQRSTKAPIAPLTTGTCHASASELLSIATAMAPALSMGGALLLMLNANKMAPKLFGQPPAEEPDTEVRFRDIAGVEEAKQELQEVVEFLKAPERFAKVGAKMPTGCLLVGPPGTGKTLLARAVAGEAGVPFFATSASQFVEMYVGVGASRVRELFNTARRKQPAIIFIDELDAVGKSRGRGLNSNDEREQTINQLLTEMDGFAKNHGIIVIAATNMAESLDEALTRPGRFDRQIYVGLPDLEGREKILRVHARGKPLATDVDLGQVARRTSRFSGADLANLLNEAAFFAARDGHERITQKNIMDALERILTGAARATKMTDERKKLVAVHEAGHALVGSLCPGYDQVTKVTIVPRGNAGGLTLFEPNAAQGDMGLYTRKYLQDRLAVALGGRVAEEAVFGESQVTNGASQDLQNAKNLARHMVEELGFNTFGPLVTTDSQEGRMVSSRLIGNLLANRIDQDVLLLVNEAHAQAKTLVETHLDKLHELSDLLCEKLDLEGDEVRAIVHR
jgi:cell division protease FtsH